ncbi:MAG: hypothetical protein JKX99_02890 [Robiginitomaculum sp.]|nr:hypothetical protein [Robiginitomaculum sp.]
MPKKILIADYKGHEIRVENTWLFGAKLYIDDECRDTTVEWWALSPKQSLLRAPLGIDGVNHLVEVFFLAIFTVKIKIHVDGVQIAGDVFGERQKLHGRWSANKT